MKSEVKLKNNIIDISLSESDKLVSLNILQENFTNQEIEKISSEIKFYLSKHSQIDHLIYSKEISFIDWFKNWLLKRNIMDFKNLISPIISNRQVHSKKLYEDLAVKEAEISSLDEEFIALHHKKLIRTTIMNYRKSLANPILDSIQKIKAKSVVEFGCGEGLILFNIMKINKKFLDKIEWSGFDFSLARSLRAKLLFQNFDLTKNKNIYIFNGDGKKVPFKDKEFDVAFCCQVIEQLKYDKEKFLNEMSRVAKYSIIQEPLYEKQSIRGKIHFRKNDYVNLSVNDIKKFGKIIDIKHHELVDPTYATSTILVENYHS